MWAWVNSTIKSVPGELCSPHQYPFSGYLALGIKKDKEDLVPALKEFTV